MRASPWILASALLLTTVAADAREHRHRRKKQPAMQDEPQQPEDKPADQPTPTPTPPQAQPQPPPEDNKDKPWAAGVSEAEQAEALRLFREGNGFFEESQYADALLRYREAIKHWDHPAIRYNMAVCLANLEEPVEAFEDLTAALKFGEAPLGPTIYPQAVTFQKLLEGRLAELEVRCKESGADLTLDGRKLFKAPGAVRQILLPGEHQIVATKPGYAIAQKKLVVLPGKKTTVVINLITVKAATRYERSWPTWKPWAVVGAGAAVALLGLPLQFLAKADINTYDNAVANTCPNGCGPPPVNPDPNDPNPPPTTADLPSNLLTRGRIENVAALSAFAVGGAVVVTGIVLVIWNQPHAVEPRQGAVAPAPTVSVVPSVGPGLAGASVTVRF